MSEGRFPHVFNLATNADITTNATCGQRGAEQFCKLVEHVKRRPGDRIQCGVCDQSSANDQHPVDYAIDGSNRWWQSPTIANGRQFNWVTITLDLKQVGSHTLPYSPVWGSPVWAPRGCKNTACSVSRPEVVEGVLNQDVDCFVSYGQFFFYFSFVFRVDVSCAVFCFLDFGCQSTLVGVVYCTTSSYNTDI